MNIQIAIFACIFCSLLVAPAVAKQDKHLPPGLQKKVERGKPLPPGWQKKYARGEVLDDADYRRGKVVIPLDPNGLVTINLDGRMLRLNQATRQIVDILQ